ncbi:MAG: RNase adapter RapZ [Eubacteriales bacterium]|nr:RNase adapter RapZ [Eubacteriales bacterium]
MEILILTGMSGAGKSLAANFLEDMGYFCVDNLPPAMIPELIQTYEKAAPQPDRAKGKRLAIVIDARSFALFQEVIPALEQVRDLGHTLRIVFLEAADQILINRYKLSRRSHPLAHGRSLAQAIALERERLAPLKEMVSDIVETSNLGPSELRDMIYAMLSDSNHDERMTILVQSFGFKYGVPVDSDVILDVRFLPNPFYIEELRPQSGLDEAVRDYVFSFEETNKYLDMQLQSLEFTIPLYIREGKVRLMIGVGCSGGRHRSVALAEALASRLKASHVAVLVDHRDLDKDSRYFRKKRN